MGFTFVAADWFGHTVVLSGEASRPASVTGPFDRESLNSVEQTFTVMVVSFMVAHLNAEVQTNPRLHRWHRYNPLAGYLEMTLSPRFYSLLKISNILISVLICEICG